MAGDPYRYFRIEARELVDELAAALAELRRGAATAPAVAGLLRHAHTLKGAARVVSLPGIADRTHALEGLLGDFRGTDRPVPADELEAMVDLVERIGDDLRALNALHALHAPEPAPPEPAAAAAVVPPPRPPVADEVEPAGGAADGLEAVEVAGRTARASLAEIEAVIDGVRETRTQVGSLREGAARLARLRERGAGPEVPPAVLESLELVARQVSGCADRIERELRQVHDVAERLRLVPVTSIVPDLEGAARDVAAAQGKRVHVEVGGGHLRLDAPVLEAVQGALRQVVRNAVAHGIEPPADRVAAGKPAGGRIRLRVAREDGHLVFSCTDDGRGIDLDAVRRQLADADADALRLPDAELLERLSRGGVSTAPTVSEVSGRGIGLDLVHDTATRLGGRVTIRTEPGSGTTIDLTTPLSLTAQEVLLVEDEQVYALPLTAVRRTVRVGAGDITAGGRGEVLVVDGAELPFVPLPAALSPAAQTRPGRDAWSVVVLTGPAGEAALGVRRLVGTATVAIRPVPARAPVSPVVSGLWMDVDSTPQLVLDADALVEAAARHRVGGRADAAPPDPILIVDDSLTTRMLERSVLESAGYRVELAASAEEGLQMAARNRYAMALVDVEMPGMDGFGFVEQTRTRPDLHGLPCILVTSRASADDRRRGLAAGARSHVDKREFHQGTLLARIADVLAGRDVRD